LVVLIAAILSAPLSSIIHDRKDLNDKACEATIKIPEDTLKSSIINFLPLENFQGPRSQVLAEAHLLDSPNCILAPPSRKI
jgi:hypothetical protein